MFRDTDSTGSDPAPQTEPTTSSDDDRGRVGGAMHEGFVSIRILWSFVRAPWVLLYPPLVVLALFTGLLVPPALVGLVAAVFDLWPLFFLVLPAAYVGPSVLGGYATVSYCHDVNEVISGRRPWPLEGLVAAIPKLPAIVSVSVLAVTSSARTATICSSDSARRPHSRSDWNAGVPASCSSRETSPTP